MEGGREEGLRVKGPSDSEIPSALPPLFRKWAMVFCVMGWIVMAGRTFSASLMVSTSLM